MFYGFSIAAQKVFRFRTEYQRDLWLKEDYDGRAYVDKAHHLVCRVASWRPSEIKGVEVEDRRN